MNVREMLDRKSGGVLLVEAGATIADAVSKMCDRGVGSAVVAGADGLPIGILTERDVLRQFAKHGVNLGTQKVGDLMSQPVVTTTPDDSLQSVMHMMTSKRFRHVPVVDGGKLVGIVSIGDVVKARLAETESEAESLRQYISTSY